jgi:hypothetical protein
MRRENLTSHIHLSSLGCWVECNHSHDTRKNNTFAISFLLPWKLFEHLQGTKSEHSCYRQLLVSSHLKGSDDRNRQKEYQDICSCIPSCMPIPEPCHINAMTSSDLSIPEEWDRRALEYCSSYKGNHGSK